MAAKPKNPARTRIELTPPDGEAESVWSDRAGNTFTLLCDLPVAPGWAAKGHNFAGYVTAVNGRTLTVEVAS